MSKRVLATVLATLLSVATLTLIGESPIASAAEDVRKVVTLGERQYLLYVPSTVKNPAPLMIAVHGYGGNVEGQERSSGFNTLAKQDGWIVAYPYSRTEDGDSSFNGGKCCGDASRQQTDDLGFFDQIIADIDKTYPVDETRVHLSGFSNGGYVSYRGACDKANVYASVAPIAGAVGVSTCKPSQPISVIHIHGLNDTTVPPRGGDGSRESFADPQNAFATQFGCTAAGTEQTNGSVTSKIATGCPAGIELETYLLAGVGHTWTNNSTFNTSKMIWDFIADKKLTGSTTPSSTTPSTTPTSSSTPSSTSSTTSTTTPPTTPETRAPAITLTVVSKNAIAVRGENFKGAAKADVKFAFGTEVISKEAEVDSFNRIAAIALIPFGFSGKVTVTVTAGAIQIVKEIMVSSTSSSTSPSSTPSSSTPSSSTPSSSVPSSTSSTQTPTTPSTKKPTSTTKKPQQTTPTTQSPPGDGSTDPVKHHLDRLQKAIERLQKLIKALLKLFLFW